MKTIISVLAVSLLLPRSVLAVWPPSTAREAEIAAPSVSTSAAPNSTVSERAAAAVTKLEEDERRLRAILQELEKSKSKLKETSHDGSTLR